MKKAKVIDKRFYDLSEKELRKMIRNNGVRPTVTQMLNYYELEVDEYIEHIESNGFRLTNEEKREIYLINNPDKCAFEHRVGFSKIDNDVICAIYDIEYEVFNGVTFYNTEQFKAAKEEVANKLIRYYEEQENFKVNGEATNLKPIDLLAMRVYRGVSVEKMASKTLKRPSQIKEMESMVEIPKNIAELYKKTLNIKDRHISQLRDIMTGKSDKVTDDRHIPKLVKLKVWKRDKSKCTNCGDKENLHFHHIEHYSKGGRNSEENLKILCASCHAEEHKGERSYHMLKSMSER